MIDDSKNVTTFNDKNITSLDDKNIIAKQIIMTIRTISNKILQ